MLNSHTLLPLIKKQLPGVSDSEIMAGIAEFAKVHPDMTNMQALVAFNQAMKGGGPKNDFSDIEGALNKPQQEQSNGI